MENLQFKDSIIDIKEVREIPMESRMQMIETLLYSVALDAEKMAEKMDKLPYEGCTTLALALKDDFGLEFRHILKRLFWGSYELPHAKNFYFGLIPNKWLRQYQLATELCKKTQNSETSKEVKPSVYEFYAKSKKD